MKKQLTEYAAALTVNMRGGKTAKSASLSGALLVIVLIFIGAGCSLFAMMLKLCEPLCTAGYERLYFIFGGILAFAFTKNAGVAPINIIYASAFGSRTTRQNSSCIK